MTDFKDSAFYHHLTPFTLNNKELYLQASFDIEHSFTGLVHIMGMHNFFIESALEIRNGIRLFEEGFKDAAFYSVRSAVETARIVTLFSTHDSPTETDIYKSWRSGGVFPFDGQIKQQIKAASSTFNEVYDSMPDFFKGQASRLRRMQKYIHKQGYKTFYWSGFASDKQRQSKHDAIKSDFDEFIKFSLIEIALLRLCVDPFPLLLNDPKVMRHIHFQAVTEPFSNDFMELIGQEAVNAYRGTVQYQSIVEFFMQNPELSEESLTVINDNYYDRNYWKIIQPEMSFLPIHDQVAIQLFNASSKIAHVYTIGGLHWYFSDVKSLRSALHGRDSRTFQSVKTANVPYDEALLSYLEIGGEEYWVEHNSLFTKKETNTLSSIEQTIHSVTESS